MNNNWNPNEEYDENGRHNYIVRDRMGGQRSLRSPEAPGDFLLAVNPEGQIKALWYSTNGMSSKLTAQEQVRDGRKYGIAHVTLAEKARRQGWSLLDELYQDDEKVNCEAVYAWYRKVNYRKSGKVEQFDDDYLPRKLFDLRAKANAAIKIPMPPPVKVKNAKAT